MRIQSAIRGRNGINSTRLLNMPISNSKFGKTVGKLLTKRNFSTSNDFPKIHKTSRRFRGSLWIFSATISLMGAQHCIDVLLPSEKFEERFVNPLTYYTQNIKQQETISETPPVTLGSTPIALHSTTNRKDDVKAHDSLKSDSDQSSEHYKSRQTEIDFENKTTLEFKPYSESEIMEIPNDTENPINSHSGSFETDSEAQFTDIKLPNHENKRSSEDLTNDYYHSKRPDNNSFITQLKSSDSSNHETTTSFVHFTDSETYNPDNTDPFEDTFTVSKVVDTDPVTSLPDELSTPSTTKAPSASNPQYNAISMDSQTFSSPTLLLETNPDSDNKIEETPTNEERHHSDSDRNDSSNQLDEDNNPYRNAELQQDDESLLANQQTQDQTSENYSFPSIPDTFTDLAHMDPQTPDPKTIKTHQPVSESAELNDSNTMPNTNYETLFKKVNQFEEHLKELQNLRKEDEEMHLQAMLKERFEKLETMYKAKLDVEKRDWLAQKQRELEEKYEKLKASNLEILNQYKDELQKSYIESSIEEKEDTLNQMAKLSATVDSYEKESLNAIDEVLNYKRLNKLISLTAKIQNQIDHNEPIAFMMNALSEFKSDDAIVNQVIESIPKELFDTEELLIVPTLYSLQKKFDQNLKACVMSSFESPKQNFIQRLFSRILGRLYMLDQNRFHFDNSLKPSNSSLPNGDNTAENNLQTLTNLAFYLQNEKLAEAVNSTKHLEGNPRDILKDWINDASLTLQVNLALSILSSHLRLLNSASQPSIPNN